MESHDETGCQAPECPILWINNCGFFGRAATMNMCSKCFKDMVLKQEHAELAASSIGNIVNGGASSSERDPIILGKVDEQAGPVDRKFFSTERSSDSSSSSSFQMPVKEGPSRCTTCQKRVGLTGFNCKCGNLFCASHCYSADKHDCPFDYRKTARDAIAKVNPVVKAEKLDKI